MITLTRLGYGVASGLRLESASIIAKKVMTTSLVTIMVTMILEIIFRILAVRKYQLNYDRICISAPTYMINEMNLPSPSHHDLKL